jgi:hypothetical protein
MLSVVAAEGPVGTIWAAEEPERGYGCCHWQEQGMGLLQPWLPAMQSCTAAAAELSVLLLHVNISYVAWLCIH